MTNALWLAWAPPVIGVVFGGVVVLSLWLQARAFDRRYGQGRHGPAE